MVWSKERSCAPSAQQRLLQRILAQYPTTASSAQYCLLCCQPQPVPGPSTAATLQLTSQDLCRLPAWLGRTINMLCRTCCAPGHSSAQARTGGEPPSSPLPGSPGRAEGQKGSKKAKTGFRENPNYPGFPWGSKNKRCMMNYV